MAEKKPRTGSRRRGGEFVGDQDYVPQHAQELNMEFSNKEKAFLRDCVNSEMEWTSDDSGEQEERTKLATSVLAKLA